MKTPFFIINHNCCCVLYFFFLVLLSWNGFISQVQACTCLAPEEPNYCSTDFFVFAQILSKVENQDKGTIRYRFKPLVTITDPKGVISSSSSPNKKSKQFHTSAASSACGVELKVGARYLIGGMHQASNNRLTLDLCRAHIELYDDGDQNEKAPQDWQKEQFKELMANCNQINKS